MIKVLVVDKISEESLQLLKSKKNLSVEYIPELATGDVGAKLSDVNALVVRTYTKVTKELLEKAPQLKLVCRVGIGLDNIDERACAEKKIAVINTPLGNRYSTAEHTVGLILALAKNIPEASKILKGGGWNQNELIGTEVYGKTLGIFGLGNIGGLVSFYARMLGMRVIACDPYLQWLKAAKLKVRLHPPDFVLKNSDFISMHVPLTDETKGMANLEFFSKMKRGSYFINCSRGAVQDEDALVSAVATGHIKGAAIDVFLDEPLKNPAKFAAPQFILTPHTAGKTKESLEKISLEAAEKIIAYFK